MRPDGRSPGELRPVRITRGFMPTAEGSVLIEVGGTRVICTATIEDRVPHFLKDKGKGWVTAEYSMLPRATDVRTGREAGRASGRTHEIQRLIGRSLRAVVDMAALGERTITVDCDVIQADGGTRTASITGAFICLAEAVRFGRDSGMFKKAALRDFVAAVSVGMAGGAPVLDLCYAEDLGAEVDMNVVMTGSGGFVEVQGTAEGAPFGRGALDGMLELAEAGIRELVELQRAHIPDGVLK